MKKGEKHSLGMVFGTFDLFHKGHEFYIRKAKKYVKNLIVIIARDARVLSGKGFLPNNHEAIRLQKVNDFLKKNFIKTPQKAILLKKIVYKNFYKKSNPKHFIKIFKKIENFHQKSTKKNAIAMLGDEKNIFLPIEYWLPEILFFGYDQRVPEEKIFTKFPNIKTQRIQSFQPNIYKSSILREKIKK